MRVVRAQGTAYERGAMIGAAFAAAMARSVAFNRRYLASHGLAQADLEGILAPYLAASHEALPDLVDQIRGMADGAEQPFWDLFFANAFEEVDGIITREPGSPPLPERCTAVALRADGRTLLGHNEQWYAGDDGAVGMVFDIPDDGPALLAPVVAGTLPLVGLNEHGAAFGTMSLSADDERVGIPRALVARSLLESSDRNDAYARASRDGRAGGYSYLCAFAGGDACVIESTASTAAVLDLDVHTNHALDPGVALAAAEPSPGSRSRLSRARVLAAETVASRDGLTALLSDHGADGQDICVHPDPADGDLGSTILFAMICDTEARTMWVASGHPCTGRFERFGFDELARAR
jgi:isopenicillin-N N-acyltransferase-like protein